MDGAPGRRSQAGLSSAKSSPFFARQACPTATEGRRSRSPSPPPPSAARSADASRRRRSPSATLPVRRLPLRDADDILINHSQIPAAAVAVVVDRRASIASPLALLALAASALV